MKLVKIKKVLKKIKEKLYNMAIKNILIIGPGMGGITEEEGRELLKYVDECFK